jgi:thiamine biosynthesis lipoprotein
LNDTDYTVRKKHPEVQADLSAIAKGFAVDEVGRALDALGFTDWLVEIGGEVRAAGVNDDGVPWRVAIEKPEAVKPPAEPGQPYTITREVQRIIGLQNAALATSGDYRNFYMAGGKRISHTIDPRTIRPIAHNLASASVIMDECALADAYATALMVLGPEEGLALANDKGIPAFLVVHAGDEFEERASQAFIDRFGRDEPATTTNHSEEASP